jgi:hypothetical protein
MKFLFFLLNMFLLLAVTSSHVAAQSKEGDLLSCGSVVSGLRLCTETLDISFKSPQNVFLRLWLENTTEKEILIQRGNFFKYLYEVKITDQNGTKLPSFYEIAAEKQKNRTINSEESGKLLRLCCMGSMPSKQTIAPKEKKLLTVDLSDIFEFKPKTVYIIEVKRIEWILDGKQRIIIPLSTLKVHID